MICCALFAIVFTQPLALLTAIGVRQPKPQLLGSVARSLVLPLPMMVVVAELAFLATVGVAVEARLQPATLGSLQHVCRLLAGPGLNAPA